MQPTLELIALVDTIGRRQPDAGLLHHSDRGSHYASGQYQALLASADYAEHEPNGQLLGQRGDGALFRDAEGGIATSGVCEPRTSA